MDKDELKYNDIEVIVNKKVYKVKLKCCYCGHIDNSSMLCSLCGNAMFKYKNPFI